MYVNLRKYDGRWLTEIDMFFYLVQQAPCMQKQTNSAPPCSSNFEILPLKFWKVSSECPFSKLEKTYYSKTSLNRTLLFQKVVRFSKISVYTKCRISPANRTKFGLGPSSKVCPMSFHLEGGHFISLSQFAIRFVYNACVIIIRSCHVLLLNMSHQYIT